MSLKDLLASEAVRNGKSLVCQNVKVICKIYILCLLNIKHIWTRNRARFTTNRRYCLPLGVQRRSVGQPASYLIRARCNMAATYSWQLTTLNRLMENLIELHKGNISRKYISNDVISKNNILFWCGTLKKINLKGKVKVTSLQARCGPKGE
jgi:hypothetical protein